MFDMFDMFEISTNGRIRERERGSADSGHQGTESAGDEPAPGRREVLLAVADSSRKPFVNKLSGQEIWQMIMLTKITFCR
ncbi:hypothetical protein [Streptomyces sp. SS]|uniref:hypothetical protein n=1 Tax=Streptomyces sp. SS TaxID=260742 RepID=UPI000FFB1B12|nr:hypothetical protein [Streptomyces sp. SS]